MYVGVYKHISVCMSVCMYIHLCVLLTEREGRGDVSFERQHDDSTNGMGGAG